MGKSNNNNAPKVGDKYIIEVDKDNIGDFSGKKGGEPTCSDCEEIEKKLGIKGALEP